MLNEHQEVKLPYNRQAKGLELLEREQSILLNKIQSMCVCVLNGLENGWMDFDYSFFICSLWILVRS